MTINIKETLEEIGKLEKTQAQLELRAAQIKEEEKKLKERLKALGVTPAELDQKITELEATINSKLTLIKSLNKPIEVTTGEEVGLRE